MLGAFRRLAEEIELVTAPDLIPLYFFTLIGINFKNVSTAVYFSLSIKEL